MSDTRERCVECGHFICSDDAPSPPAPAEVERLRKGRDEYERQIASRGRTIRADSAALASVTAEADRLRAALTEIDRLYDGRSHVGKLARAALTPAPSKEGDGE